jgi:hypothetical protein
LEKVKKYYNSVFAEGMYSKKAPPAKKNDSQTPHWNLESFIKNFRV